MSGKATQHFFRQRATAMLQIPLVIWLVISLVRHLGDSHAEIITWLSQPLTAGLLATFIASITYHMHLGMNEVLDDYIPSKKTRSGFMKLNMAFAVLVAMVALFSLIAITLIA